MTALNRVLFKTFALVLLVAALAGCNKLTVDNYGKLKVGMTYDEVQSILGKPARCDEAVAVRACSWGDAQRRINVNFLGGKVMLFSAENIK
jgi:hypothetical protein